ncbi:YheC/YheD family endospore coat-associated protein [Bacillus sp. 2205SS5-2]|uniref:YheC/YheD family endospore coat-associated protein n=1 Tax=Bacillus sp. 2205SS5-2 TaxID=3109031 RepID=UPI00300444DD
MNSRVFITKKQLERCSLLLHPSLLEANRLSEGEEVELFFGKKSSQLKVGVSTDVEKHEIHLSSVCWDELHLPEQHKTYQLTFSSSPLRLTLGPLVVVLTGIPKSIHSPYFHSLEHFLVEFHELIEEKGGFVYISDFSKIEKGLVKGYYYSNQVKKWEESLFPIPDVIYNRVHSRKNERTPAFKHFITWCDSHNIWIFNERFLTKWEVHEALNTDKLISKHLPDTILYKESNQVLSLLDHYGDIFIKPIDGSQGRNIFRIQSQKEQYILFHTEKEHEIFFSQSSELIQALTPLLTSSRFLIQQTLHLHRIEEKLFDFRLILMPDQHKSWHVISSVVRLSKQNAIVTNLAQGGEMERAYSFLHRQFGSLKSHQLWKEMQTLSFQIAESLTNELNIRLGELGIDLGIDENEKIWLIEVNSKPSKNFAREGFTRPSVKGLYHYIESVWLERNDKND